MRGPYILFFLFVAFSSLGQPAEELAKYKAKYPNESSIYLMKQRDVLIDLTSTGELDVSEKVYEKQFILDRKISNISTKSLQYSSFTPIDNIEAHTFIPNNKKYKKVAVEDFKTKDVLEGAIFHNDIKAISFHYTGLETGAQNDLSYRRVYNEPRFLSSFYLAEGTPIEKTKFTVKVHEDVNIAYVLKNCEDLDIDFSEKVAKGYKIYTWSMESVPELKYESGAQGILYYVPHIIVRIKDYTINGGKKNLLATVDDLYGWYNSLLKDVNKDDQSELKKIADSLVTGIDSEEEKVKRIYYWVQDNIKYVAFEDGLGGFIPRNATAVCDKRYGDCKDMASITTTMLKLVGINGHLTWIGTTDIPYKYEEVPTPSVDNHMIGAYKTQDGRYIFLDATSNHQPFGLPTGFIQGKEAMVNEGDGKFKIVPVPVMDASRSFWDEEITLELNDNKLVGKGNAKIDGYYKVNLAYDMDGTTQDQRLEYMTGYLRKGSNKFLIDDLKIEEVTNREVPTKIDYKFNIADYHNKAGDEIYVNMNLEKSYINESIKDDRELPIENKFKSKLGYKITLNVPSGYEITYVPENFQFEHEKFSFLASYTKSENKIDLNMTIVNNYTLLDKQDFSDWNKMIKVMKKAYTESVIIKKKQ